MDIHGQFARHSSRSIFKVKSAVCLGKVAYTIHMDKIECTIIWLYIVLVGATGVLFFSISVYVR